MEFVLQIPNIKIQSILYVMPFLREFENIYIFQISVFDRMEHLISFRKISKSFGDNKVIAGLDLDIEQGEILGLVGKSGCGNREVQTRGSRPAQGGKARPGSAARPPPCCGKS